MAAPLEVLTSIFLWVVRASWQTAVLVCMILIVQWVFRNRLSPGWRYALWILVVVRLMMPMSPASPTSVFNLGRLWTGNLSSVASQFDSARGETSSLHAEQVQVQPRPVEFLPTSGVAISYETSADSQILDEGSAHIKLSFITCLALLWLLGATLLMLRTAGATLRVFAMVRSQRPVGDRCVLEVMEECKRVLGIRRPVAAVESEDMKTPALVGFLTGKLLLPKKMIGTFSRQELRHVLFHELVHIKQHDVALNWFMCILQILHWFNPLVWLAFARMRMERELACDSLALTHCGDEDGQAYGRTMLRLVQCAPESRALPGTIGILEDHGQIKKRIMMIGNHNAHVTERSILGITVVAVLCMTGLTDAFSRTSPVSDRHKTEVDEATHNESSSTDIPFLEPSTQHADVTIGIASLQKEWNRMAEIRQTTLNEVTSQEVTFDYSVKAEGREPSDMSSQVSYGREGIKEYSVMMGTNNVLDEAIWMESTYDGKQSFMRHSLLGKELFVNSSPFPPRCPTPSKQIVASSQRAQEHLDKKIAKLASIQSTVVDGTECAHVVMQINHTNFAGIHKGTWEFWYDAERQYWPIKSIERDQSEYKPRSTSLKGSLRTVVRQMGDVKLQKIVVGGYEHYYPAQGTLRAYNGTNVFSHRSFAIDGKSLRINNDIPESKFVLVRRENEIVYDVDRGISLNDPANPKAWHYLHNAQLQRFIMSESRWAEAQSMADNLLVKLQSNPEVDAAKLAMALEDAADVYSLDTNAHDKAIGLYEHAQQAWDDAKGGESIEQAQVLMKLGGVYGGIKNYAAQAVLLEESLRIYEVRCHDESQIPHRVLQTLAHVYELQGRTAEAEAMLRRWMRREEPILEGEDHYLMLGIALYSLARFHGKNENIEKAELYFKRYVDSAKEHCERSNDVSTYVNALGAFACFLSENGRDDEATALKLRVEEIVARRPSLSMSP